MKKQVLYSNNYDFDEVRADLEAANDFEITDDMVWDEIQAIDNGEWAFFESEYSARFNVNDFVLMGTLGRWNGRYKVSKIIKGWSDIVSLLASYDSIEIADEDGHLIIKVSDHDGSSRFELRELTQKGWEYINLYSHYDKSEYEEAKTLWNNFYSRLPKLAA